MDPVSIGSRLEPFVDDYLIDSMRGLSLQLGHPVRREPAIFFDAPWEGESSGYQTIFADDDGHRLYYRGCQYSRGPEEFTCVARSDDGVHWTRPNLGLFEFQGSKDNNIVWAGAGAHAFAPFKDTRPGVKASERYKAVAPVLRSKTPQLFAYASADGYRWRLMQDQPILDASQGHFDSQNLAFWDPNRQRYACYFRRFKHAEWPKGSRDIKVCTSDDFIHWDEPQWLEYPGAPEQELYTNAIAPYFRAPHIYFGFPKRYVKERKDHGGDGFSDGVFMSSRDGLHFHRWVEAFMRPGTNQENWLDRNNLATWGMIQSSPEEISLYYLECNYKPSHNLMRATIRTDGFVSLHAGGRPGTMLTKPLIFDGRELVINYSTSAIGYLRVEVQDAEGRAIKRLTLRDCPPHYGDSIERVVSWKSGSDLSALSGKAVRLKFRMLDADLYSIRFRS